MNDDNRYSIFFFFNTIQSFNHDDFVPRVLIVQSVRAQVRDNGSDIPAKRPAGRQDILKSLDNIKASYLAIVYSIPPIELRAGPIGDRKDG